MIKGAACHADSPKGWEGRIGVHSKGGEGGAEGVDNIIFDMLGLCRQGCLKDVHTEMQLSVAWPLETAKATHAFAWKCVDGDVWTLQALHTDAAAWCCTD